ncbi:hypothetical protein [Actinacidiphila bryophytorum]|jgi:hypothetical protein|uniref:Cytochrome c family protein n=1 Tax=Actinacidiphila bryophytorum TaxID=1436133 RepID=A0A9W4MHF3_9ACTN|nr:hypothetical protein [Actinacidiphila bryophytorum]MBM9437488.1 hypothetical protein [Actinacidiphila bryophytorum]MBN6544804.1 hypothetical protein [Actinacidiphila bryophytorum]UWE09663.1 hypothetical protein NYE86_13685 [Actinacidiphila bryophytorum]CAG7656193.1 Cytochrome c family protein [Actinacidiphila bryophytorum]
MSRTRARALALLPAGALAALLLAGCGSHGSAAGTPGSTSPAPAASELAHMQKLVDDADAAASAADTDAASDN